MEEYPGDQYKYSVPRLSEKHRLSRTFFLFLPTSRGFSLQIIILGCANGKPEMTACFGAIDVFKGDEAGNSSPGGEMEII